MSDQKSTFIKNKTWLLFQDLPADAKGNWGKMNAQQTVEHLADFFNVSSEKIKFDLVTPEEHLPKYKDFLLSDKEFRENTKAPVNIVSEEPVPLRFASMDEAIDNLKTSVEDFYNHFENDHDRKSVHPVFGPLNFDEWVLLHYKHVMHHQKQFGLYR